MKIKEKNKRTSKVINKIICITFYISLFGVIGILTVSCFILFGIWIILFSLLNLIGPAVTNIMSIHFFVYTIQMILFFMNSYLLSKWCIEFINEK